MISSSASEHSHSILHFVPGDLAVAVGIEPLEGCLDIGHRVEVGGELLDGCHRVGHHHGDKLLVVDATRLVHVADGEDLVDLSVAELAHHLPQLVPCDVAIAVNVKLAESRLHLVQILERLLQLADSGGCGREHEEDKLPKIDLTVTVSVALPEQLVHLLVRGVLASGGQHLLQLVPVDGTVAVLVKAEEGSLDVLDPAEGNRSAHQVVELSLADLAIAIEVGHGEDDFDLLVVELHSGGPESILQLLDRDGAVIVGVKLLESSRDLVGGAKGLLDHADLLIGGGQDHAGKLTEADLAVVVDVADGEDCRELALGELSHGGGSGLELLERDLTVAVSIEPLEGLLHRADVLQAVPQLGKTIASSREEGGHELVVVDLTVLVDVSESEDGADLSRREPGTRLGDSIAELLLGKGAVTVGVEPLEGADHLVDVPEAVPELVKTALGGGAHESDELRQADLTVLVNVSKSKDNLGVLVGESEPVLQLLFAHGSVVVGVDPLEAVNHGLLVGKLRRAFSSALFQSW